MKNLVTFVVNELYSMRHIRFFSYLLLTSLFTGCGNVNNPDPCLPIPSEKQLEWHRMEMYGFIHFSINTFTDREWGYGDEDPSLFNPLNLDCKQWVNVFKEAGFKGIIITAKHHDGFCLWPTSTTEHSVKNSPWKNGKGDVIRELSNACKEAGLKMGVYISPWDRNSPYYGDAKYIELYKRQITELLTEYGEMFEVWFDGANGGDGYYGGARENRHVDRNSYYNWPDIFSLVKELQPDALIFSDGGPDVRWLGNESAIAGKTNWSMLNRDEFYPGTPRYQELTSGHQEGTYWVPAEADVSIRKGWYYHSVEDDFVKTPERLMDIYYTSVGRNASLLLNVPVNREGLISDKDIASLQGFSKRLENEFENEITHLAKVTSDNDRGRGFRAKNVLSEDSNRFWSASQEKCIGTLTFTFNEPVTINRILLQEPIHLGQRVKNFSIEVENNGNYQTVADETTIGYKRILKIDDIVTKEVRIIIKDTRAVALVSKVSLFHSVE